MKHEKKNSITPLLIPLGIVFLVLAISLFITFGAYAQNQISAQSLEISPPSQEITADPGQRIAVKARVRNASRETLPVKVRIEDFTAEGEEGQVALIDRGAYSLINWTSITPSSFSLKPGETQEVTAEINIPQTKIAGGYYGSFVFSVTGEKQPNAAVIGQEVASLFLMKITGPIDERLYLDEVRAPSFSEFGPVPITVKLTNTGNVHTKAFGLINITDMFGQKVTDLVISGTNVFPGASRTIATRLHKTLLFGKYTATAIVYFGSVKNETLTAATTFVVVPYRLIAIVITLAFILYLLRKRLKKALRALIG